MGRGDAYAQTCVNELCRGETGEGGEGPEEEVAAEEVEEGCCYGVGESEGFDYIDVRYVIYSANRSPCLLV